MTRRTLLAIACLEIRHLVFNPIECAFETAEPILTRKAVQEIERILSLTPEQRLDEIRYLPEALLGVVALENLGLVFDPFRRALHPMRMLMV